VKLGWLSDIHLNFLDEKAVHAFMADLAARDVDAWLLGGDIGEANSILRFLQMFEDGLPCKTYFALGNHDFYGSSLADVRTRVGQMASHSRRLVWLTESDPQLLADGVAIVGDDAWADARFGNARGTTVELNDFYLIRELTDLPRAELVRRLNDLGDEAAVRLAQKLERAAASREHVVVLTHVPPFWEAAWHQGKPSGEDWVPWFACQAVGEAILSCAAARPQTGFIVLCGHTHGAGTCTPAPNVTVHTAGAEYGAPGVQRLFDIGRPIQPGERFDI
jgi:predicted phosphohydrolase